MWLTIPSEFRSLEVPKGFLHDFLPFRLLNFINATRSTSNLSLVGCPLPDPLPATPPPTLAIEGAVESDNYAASQLSEVPAQTGGKRSLNGYHANLMSFPFQPAFRQQ